MTLPTIEGIDAYSESAMKIDPADGTKRVWMIWAHWCPYCQQELPDLNAWWADASGNYPTAELITVTTSMDPSRGNPLEPYLEDQQFVFPVVVDTDTRIAAQMGVNAFPFWIVTDGDGTVLFRTAGLLDIDRVETLFSQLEQFES
jgi:thiol-disulfide isomerase/thioredoxin